MLVRRHGSCWIGVMLLLSAAGCERKIYHGKPICQVVSPDDIREIFQTPFQAGISGGSLDDDEHYVGSTCNYDSVEKWNPKVAKFRVYLDIRYISPGSQSIAGTLKRWQKETYRNQPFYKSIKEIADFSGAGVNALTAYDYNRSGVLWTVLQPRSTELYVSVQGIVEDEAERYTLAVARKTMVALGNENAPPPTP